MTTMKEKIDKTRVHKINLDPIPIIQNNAGTRPK